MTSVSYKIVNLSAALALFTISGSLGCGLSTESLPTEPVVHAPQQVEHIPSSNTKGEPAVPLSPAESQEHAELTRAGTPFSKVPTHAVVVCDSASFYANYNSSTGPYGFIRTLYRGNKIGHTPGVHPVHNGWAAAQDFGPGDWGYMRYECIGLYGSWLNGVSSASADRAASAPSTPTVSGPYSRGTIGKRETVCARDLYVRTAGADGPWDGVLYQGQSFLVESRSGDYVYGFAYGYINRKGWVQDGWFCP